MNSLRNGPAERALAQPNRDRDVAVYLDFENLYVSLKTTVKMDPNFDILMEKCREFGRVTVARAYADWSEFTRMLTSQMFANGFEPVYVPTRKFYDAKTRGEARKNSVDIHITIDIVKSLFQHENVDVIILISGDRDYVPLINQIRQHGKSVYAIGVAGCTSNELSIAVDEMLFYHQLLETGEEATEQVDVYNQLMKAIRIARRRGYPTTLGILKPIMKELIEGFNERNYKNGRGQPFQKFKDLVTEAQGRHMVRAVTTGAVTEVFLYAEDAVKVAAEATAAAPAAPAREREPGTRGTRGGRGGRGGRDRHGRERRPAAADAPEVVLADADAAPDLGDTMPAAEGDAESTMPLVASGDTLPVTAAEVEPVAETPEVADVQDQLTGLGFSERTWEILRGVMEKEPKPPSPRRLVTELKKLRDEGAFGEPTPTDADMLELIRQAVEAGKLQKVRKAFRTFYEMKQPDAASA